ncbi:MAG: class I SAM-dependent methyltransferase [Candidatus Peribacteraceae bacterium]|nr:class I SAM-dependent methyltransferase [Candidatus Peribacteraceae bacterium]
MSDSKNYTQDWFDRCIPVWKKYLSEFYDKPNLKFLEIGSYEGRSTCWLLDNILTAEGSTIHCFDLFEGCAAQGVWSEELYNRYDMSGVLVNFLNNTDVYGNKVKLHIGVSQRLLRGLGGDAEYDFVYVDGSHIASDVLEDTVLAFRLLKSGGIMILDDYTWEFFDSPLRHPKLGIDAFLSVYECQYEILHKDQQIILRKTGVKEG